MGSSRTVAPIALLAVAFGLGCPRVAVDLEGRSCDESGKCTQGYRCHPDTNICVHEHAIDCGNIDAICPEEIDTGMPCSSVGSFIPCHSGYDGCEAGCRTCEADGTWSECVCRVGTLHACRDCDQDCAREIQNAPPECVWNSGSYDCTYTGSCNPGFRDRDLDLSNGCECGLTSDGVEVCDGIDNDCDNEVDENNPCPGVAVCEGGTCVPCTDADPLHCGPSCQVCTGVLDGCASGDCVCTENSCPGGPNGQWCDVGACTPCTNDDPLHCGSWCEACAPSTPDCVGGSCECNATSCPAGEWCDAGTCVPCADNDPAHCGSQCLLCPGGTPDCVGGACRCNAGSCDPGQWCDAVGSCAPCDVSSHCGSACRVCPTLFPVCADAGGSVYGCECDASSCTQGAQCTDNGKTCLYFDDFDGGSSALFVCAVAINNSWQLGTPAFTACYSGNTCWGTHLVTDYNDCEQSCLTHAPLDLAGVTGTIELWFQAKYNLESNYDGVTVRFLSDSGWSAVTPQNGWDVSEIVLGQNCVAFTDPVWPGWGQYQVTTTIGWEQKHFQLTDSQFFHSAFRWIIYLVTDGNTHDPGFFLDDVFLRVHHDQ